MSAQIELAMLRSESKLKFPREMIKEGDLTHCPNIRRAIQQKISKMRTSLGRESKVGDGKDGEQFNDIGSHEADL